jgi:hypothetical protein
MSLLMIERLKGRSLQGTLFLLALVLGVSCLSPPEHDLRCSLCVLSTCYLFVKEGLETHEKPRFITSNLLTYAFQNLSTSVFIVMEKVSRTCLQLRSQRKTPLLST